ncbi:PREDICTED: uncharacterized protein LOC108569410 isoform X1 [Nicrophorus vespilloides]|uniref:Uncharacterized protein LOC108569410 isoform X1 n=1 Tax=Nicrophorus vespilloides TaxID=110193 RepID=A0ABM1NHZ0_NICVS|nr:PREDICTED: uncharacterized protein LOC108569410 isoform X1 [Nicrophorus vespilloides]
MKTAFVVFIVSMTFVCAEKLRYSTKYVDKIENAKRQCANEENIDVQLIYLLDDIKDLPKRENLKCLSFCTTKKLNLLDSQSLVNFDKLIQLFDDPDLIAKVSSSYTACNFKENQMKSCENGYDMHNCLLTNL